MQNTTTTTPQTTLFLTAIPAGEAQSTSAIYLALYKIVRPALQHYETDLTKHDKKAIEEEPRTPFIYGYRETGTNLIKLYPNMAEYEAQGLKVGAKYIFGTIRDEAHKLEILRDQKTWITHRDTNKYFLFFDGVKLHKKTREQINEIHDNHIQKVIAASQKNRQ
jgi:hypothetical protein